jgi:UDP-N-acetylmuramoylalanine--D-glutamate ligase
MMHMRAGQTVVIMGAARQGLALARYLLTHGVGVILTDMRPLEALQDARASLADLEAAGLPLTWACGGHPLSLLDGADWLCPSGGVPLETPIVQEALRRGIPLSNDSQVFLELAPCRVIGITGSAGKTTTTTLVGRMAQAAAGMPAAGVRRAWIGGNIGSPLIADVDAMQPDDLVVMELSSFQLEIMTRSPQVAAILNITPNHLDRHGTMQAYTAAKAHILAHQTGDDVAVLGRDDHGAWGLAGQVHGRLMSFGFTPLPDFALGGLRESDRLLLKLDVGSDPIPVLRRDEILLPGEHNVLNALAACTIAAAAGLPLEAMRRGVQGFKGVAHRLELVSEWGGARWYNDSIATAPERAMAAIHAFDAPLVLLAGGRDKKLPWGEFAKLVQRRVKALVTFGEAGPMIADQVQAAGDQLETLLRCQTLQEAVHEAARIVQPGDVVLLSPGGTSFDAFKDFEERGRCFVQLVNELE